MMSETGDFMTSSSKEDGSMKSNITTCYRFVTDDLESKHSDKVKWTLGEWKKLGNTAPLELCHNGFHASRSPLDSLEYVFGSRWFMAETRGEILEDTDKLAAREMRLVKEIPTKTIQQFAIACARHVLPCFEKAYPKDKRPREALEAAEKYLEKPSKRNFQKLEKAVAAAGAAWAAWAAWATADTTGDANAAVRAAWAAADGVWAAARDAADAARDAAAWAAVDAAWAVRAAWAAAAWAAADAAWDAAWDAARDEEREWQRTTLEKMVNSALLGES